jgi:hypothetical protein
MNEEKIATFICEIKGFQMFDRPIVSAFPTKYIPHLALDWATQRRLMSFRNPILSTPDRTNETMTYLFSSP